MRLVKEGKVPGLAAAAFALAAAGCLPRLLNWAMDATHSAVMLLLAGLLWRAGKAVLEENNRRLRRFSLAFGLAFAFCQLLGARLDSAGTVSGGVPLLLVCTLCCAPAAGGLFLLLARKTNGAASAPQEGTGASKRTFWLTFGALLLCWLPYYLAYFPGMFNYDSAGEAAQFTTGQYNGAFPPLHTLLLAAFYRLGGAVGSYNAGIALYTAVQACAAAAALAYANALLCRRGVKRGFRVLLAAAYGLLPGLPLLVMSTTKDLFFCAALLPLLCLLAEGGREPERLKKRGYAAAVVLLTALSCLLRPNGAAAIGMALIFGWFWMPREGRRRFAALLLCGLLLFAGANQGMKAVLHPSKTGLRELLSVPLAQVSRVYVRHQETLTEPEKEEILSLIPDAERYQPHLADGIKRHTAVGVSTLPRFLRLYGRLLRQYPAEFADAWEGVLASGRYHPSGHLRGAGRTRLYGNRRPARLRRRPRFSVARTDGRNGSAVCGKRIPPDPDFVRTDRTGLLVLAVFRHAVAGSFSPEPGGAPVRTAPCGHLPDAAVRGLRLSALRPAAGAGRAAADRSSAKFP